MVRKYLPILVFSRKLKVLEAKLKSPIVVYSIGDLSVLQDSQNDTRTWLAKGSYLGVAIGFASEGLGLDFNRKPSDAKKLVKAKCTD